MKRLILGKGKVSNVIQKKDDIVLSRHECDITDYELVSSFICDIHPDVIINCAAKTDLENCENFKIESYHSNVTGVMNLVELCSMYGVKLVHISSGCLFDGNNFVADENTNPSPSVWYTWTKKWADEIIQNHGYDNYLILRPRQLISRIPHRSNMITKFASMKSLPAIDEQNSITCIEDFSEMIDHLLSIDATGMYNCCNDGTVSPYDIGMLIKNYINPDLSVSKISYDDLLDILPNRRVNTVLSCDKLKNTGYEPRSAHDALRWCVTGYSRHD